MITKNQLLRVLLFFLMAAPLVSRAQKIAVSGRVTDQQGIPLPGVTVAEKGTIYATLTDAKGAFTFSITDRQAVIAFSKPEYRPLEMPVNETAFLNVTITRLEERILPLATDSIAFELFTWRAANSSRVTTVSPTRPHHESATGLSKRLQSIPGTGWPVTEYQPGSPGSLALRGVGSALSNDPLYVVDGIVMNAGIHLPRDLTFINPLAGLNVKDINNITLLKDHAGTALYGSAGANGVVLITTKPGGADSLRFSYHMQAGVRNPLSSRTKMMPAETYRSLISESLTAAGYDPLNESPVMTAVDWYDRILRSALYTDHTLSVSGGTRKSDLYLSGHIQSDRGVIAGSGVNAGGLRFNHAWRPAKWFRTGLHAGYSQSSMDALLSPSAVDTSNPLVYAAVYPPVSRSNLAAWPLIANRFGSIDPVDFLNRQTAKNSTSQFDGSFSLQLRMGKYVTVNSSLSGSYNDFGASYNRPRLSDDRAFTGNYANRYQTGWISHWRAVNFFRFEKLEGKSHWLVLIGSEESNRKANNNIRLRTPGGDAGLPESDYRFNGNSSQRTSAIFGQANYAYHELFDLALTFRREALQRLYGPELYGIFPAASAGLRIYKNRWTDHPVLSSLKIKAGWGVPGANPFHYMHYSRPDESGIPPANAMIHPGLLNEFPVEAPAPNAPWETSEEWNFGLQSWWLGNDLSVEFNYFDRLRSHVAYRFADPESEGNPIRWGHTGRIKNSGIEAEFSYRKELGKVGLTGNAFVRYSENQLLAWGSDYPSNSPIPLNPNTFKAFNYLKVGEPVGVFLGYQQEGIFQSPADVDAANAIGGDPATWYQHPNTAPGDIRFADIDNSGSIDENDRTVIGSPVPAFTLGITTGAFYRDFDLNLSFDGAFGYDVMNYNRSWSHATGGLGNRAAGFADYWKPFVPSTTLPRVHIDDPNHNSRPHSGMVHAARFFRLNKLDAGYTFSFKKQSRYARVYLLFENLFTMTNYRGETPYPGGNGAASGIDYGNYPGASLAAIGLQLGL